MILFLLKNQVWSVNRAKRCLAGVAKLWDLSYIVSHVSLFVEWLFSRCLNWGWSYFLLAFLWSFTWWGAAGEEPDPKWQGTKFSKDFPSNALRLHHDNSPAKSDWDSQLYFWIIVNPTTVDCQRFSTIPWRGCNAVGYWDRIAWSFTFRSNEPPPANQASSSCPVSIGLLMLLILRWWRGLKFTLGWNVFGLSHIECDELFWLVATGWVLDSGHLVLQAVENPS